MPIIFTRPVSLAETKGDARFFLLTQRTAAKRDSGPFAAVVSLLFNFVQFLVDYLNFCLIYSFFVNIKAMICKEYHTNSLVFIKLK